VTRRALPILAPVLAALGLAGAARALPLGIQPNTLGYGGAEIELVAVVAGAPAAGSPLEGAIAPGDATLVFRVGFVGDVFAPSVHVFVREADTSAPVAPTGGGVIPGAGLDVAGVQRVMVATDTELVFRFPFETAAAGSAGDLIFASWPALAGGDVVWIGFGTRSERIPTFGRVDFLRARIVPGPAPAPALALSALLFAARAARRRSA
jgi:hypothetical protein